MYLRKPQDHQHIKIQPDRTSYIVVPWLDSNMFPHDLAIACQGRADLDRYFRDGRFRSWDSPVTLLVQGSKIVRCADNIHAHPMDEKFITTDSRLAPNRTTYLVAPWVESNLVPYEDSVICLGRDVLEQQIQSGRFVGWEPTTFVLQHDKVLKCADSVQCTIQSLVYLHENLTA